MSPLRCALGQALSASFGSSETDGEILRGAQDDSLGLCHPERREGPLVHIRPATLPHGLADFWGITSS